MKKFISIFAVVLMAVILMLPASAKTLLLGDVNTDGSVTAKDARTILRVAAHLEELTDEEKLIADVDKSGDVTAKDARMVLRVSAKLESELGSIDVGTTTEPSADPTTAAPTTAAPTTEKPTAATPTTAKPVTTAPAADESTTTAPTTEAPTTAEPVTDEPTTAEPISEEPSSEEPISEEPSSETPDGDRVEYESLPAQIKAFLSGKFGFKGSSYMEGGKTPISMYTDGKSIRASMTMRSEGTEMTMDVLMTEEKGWIGGTKKVAYFVNSEKKIYCDIPSSMANMDDLDVDFGDYDPSEAYAYVSEKAVGGETYTLYTIPSESGNVEIYMLGEDIKSFQVNDASGNIQSKMDIDEFYAELPADIFSLTGYKKVTILQIADVLGVDLGL